MTAREPGSELTLPSDDTGADTCAEGVWATELDRLEVEVLWTERLLRAAQPLERQGWSPREDMPPLPPALEQRARALLARQEETRASLVEAMRDMVRDRAVAARGGGYDRRPSHADEPSRYIDLVG